MSRIGRLLAGAVLAAVAQATPGCGTDAIGTDACRKIEQARCRKAPSCPALMLQSNGVEECTQFARDRCLHGLAVPDPGAPVVDSCVAAIDQASCDVVASPETAPQCAFLRPSPLPEAGPDGATDAPSESTDQAAPDASATD
jgi:hypothetical protein